MRGEAGSPQRPFRLKPEPSPASPKLRLRELEPARPISWRQRALWVVLALVPSALLLGVTQHLATDVVSAPLLWVVPLALYLTTFIAAFSHAGDFGSRAAVGEPWRLVGRAARPASSRWRRCAIRSCSVALVHLAAFTVLAMLCHTRLAESRPDAAHLTEYFACVSLGGVLGGAAAALVAPVVFSSILEYPLALAAALFLRPQTLEADRAATSRARRLAWRVGAALLLVAGYWCVSALNEQGTSSPLTTSASFAWLQSFTADVAMRDSGVAGDPGGPAPVHAPNGAALRRH